MDTKYAIIQWNIEEGSFSDITAIGFFHKKSQNLNYFWSKKKPFLAEKTTSIIVFFSFGSVTV